MTIGTFLFTAIFLLKGQDGHCAQQDQRQSKQHLHARIPFLK
jgi:hypothetical protein